MATTLAILGVAASFAGKAYGQIGQGLPLAASGLAIIMGLNLLEVLGHLLIFQYLFILGINFRFYCAWIYNLSYVKKHNIHIKLKSFKLELLGKLVV